MTSYFLVKSSQPLTMTGLLTLTHFVSKIASNHFYTKWVDWMNPRNPTDRKCAKNTFRIISVIGTFATAKVLHYGGQKSNLDMPSFVVTLGIAYCNELVSSVYENYYEMITLKVIPTIRFTLTFLAKLLNSAQNSPSDDFETPDSPPPQEHICTSRLTPADMEKDID